MIRRRHANEVVAGQEREEGAVDHGTEIDEGTETDEADHGKERTVQKTIEETEADPEKGKGSGYTF